MKTDVVKQEDVQVERRECRDEIMPNTAVRQDKDGFLLVAELPGVDDKSLQVTVEDSVLLIEAANTVAEPEGYTLALREISPVTYKASFELPDRVDAAGVKASLKNGLLRVQLPISEAKKPKRIAIAAE
ncbi:MAG: Hsp20/alpha crystallin family protein [Lentisphaerae bacterium]|nr:Hsp20/alpha crystallin family protein [Lentisphaerota bacterium]